MSTAPDLAANPAEKQKIYMFNSTVLYLLAYLIMYLVNQAVTIFMARSNRIPAELFPGHIDFKIADNAWRAAEVISTYGPGPAVCLALAFLSVLFFNRVKNLGGLRKLFYLWLTLHGFNFFFGGLIAGSAVRGGFWYAFRWSLPSDAVVYGIAFFFGLVLLFIGFLMAPGFLISCDSITLVQYENRRKLLMAMVVWPWLLGSFLLFLLKFPDFIFYDAFQYLTMLLMLLPVYFFNMGNPFSETVEEPFRTHFAAGLGIGLAILLLVYRVSLQNGISFG